MRDIADLQAAYDELLEAAASAGASVPSEDDWGVDTVLAHVVASSRMLAAASAELLSSRIPVVDNRPTQCREYLDAIVSSAGSREALLGTVRNCGHELTLLASQLPDGRELTSVPTIIVDAGRTRVERPVPFSTLLDPSHVREHLGQLRSLADRDDRTTEQLRAGTNREEQP